MAEIYIGDQQISGGGGSGETFDPSYLEEGLLDVSTRVDALEQIDYVETNDISTFVTQSAFDSSYVALDTSVKALDASALTFDASIKELASSAGGGGGTSPFEYIDSKYAIINKDSLYDANVQLGQYAVILNGYNYSYNYTKATGMYSIAGGECCKATGARSVALGGRAQAEGDQSVALGSGAQAYGRESVALGSNSYARGENSFAVGGNSMAYSKNSIAIGYFAKANQQGSVAIGYSANSSNNYEIATGYFNNSIKNNTTFGSELNTLGSIGNGYNGSQTIRHNAFEVRQSGDIYIPDVSASGEYYEKPMINLQQKLYALDASIQAVSGGSGGGSTPDLTNYIDYTTASNAGLTFGAQRNFIESITATNVTGTTGIVAGNMSGNFIYLDPVSCDISFSYNGETGSISLMDLYNFLMNYN